MPSLYICKLATKIEIHAKYEYVPNQELDSLMVFLLSDKYRQKVMMDDGTRMVDIMRENMSFSKSILWRLQNSKLLMVDDNEYNLFPLRHYLQNSQFDLSRTTEASNGQEAVDLVNKSIQDHDMKYCQYRLILMDINMPIMDGL